MKNRTKGRLSHLMLWGISGVLFPLFSGACAFGGDIEVSADGRYAGNSPSAREVALADALREAVRIGAGVNVASQSKASDLSLDYDRVFEAAFGYVRDYRITSSGLGRDGIYHVTVSAHVNKGTPEKNDITALKQLVALRHSPRIAFNIVDEISLVPKNSGWANAWFMDEAKNLQLNVVDLPVAGSSSEAHHEAQISNPVFPNSPKVDYLITGKVKGRYEIPEGGGQNGFALTADLQAVIPETGEVIATQLILPLACTTSDLTTAQMAAREAVFKVLRGSQNDPDSGGKALFRKILVRWATELDLGHIVRVEFIQINAPELKEIQDKLKENARISGVWPREFNEKGSSYLDIETRLDSSELIKAIGEASDNDFGLSHGTEHCLTFAKGASGSGKKGIFRWFKSLWGKLS